MSSQTLTVPGPIPLAGGGVLPRRRAFVLVRFTAIIATAYLLLAEANFSSLPGVVMALLAMAFASNVVLMRLPSRFFDSTAVTTGILLGDTAWITGGLLYSGRFEAEFFYLYFFILFLAGIGENLRLVALGAVVVSTAYLFGLSTATPLPAVWSSAYLIRIPFFLTVATFYAYLIERVRSERQRAQAEACTVAELEAAQGLLAEHVERLNHANRELQREVAERVRAEEELRKANDELRELSEMKSSFISIVSHELKTPLTCISNALEILGSQKAGELNAQQERFVTMARRNGERLGTIMNDLLDLSKIEAGKLRLRFTEVDLGAIVRHLVDELSSEAKQKDLALKMDWPADLSQVWGDPERLEQVLSNLLSNALKFTPAGGRIVVSARSQGEEVEVSVADTGIGLSQEEQRRVFERFYQAGDPLTRKVKGSGLGLSIASDLVRAHGSRLSVDSEPQKGSRFFFRLPVFSPRAMELTAFDQEIEGYWNSRVFSLLLVELQHNGERRNGSSRDHEEALERLHQLVAASLPRANDHVTCQPAAQRLVITLDATPRDGAATVKRRLEKELSKSSILGDEAGSPVPVVLGPASYPEDGLSGRELIASVYRTN